MNLKQGWFYLGGIRKTNKQWNTFGTVTISQHVVKTLPLDREMFGNLCDIPMGDSCDEVEVVTIGGLFQEFVYNSCLS